jgi:hypothetical protein
MSALARHDRSRHDVRINTESNDQMESRRPLNWGIVLIGDRDTRDIPVREPDESIASNPALVVVPVRHAQDVEASDRKGVRSRCSMSQSAVHRV